MIPHKFIIPLDLHKDICSIKQTKSGLCIKYEDEKSIDVYCDILTGAYYKSKLSYEVMYKKSVNQEILDYLMTNITTEVIGYSCEYDNFNKFVIKVGGFSIKCDKVNKEIKEDIEVLVDYLRTMDSLKQIERFIDMCETEPLLINEGKSSILKYGDQELELTTEDIQYVMTHIKNNLHQKRKQRWHRNLMVSIGVILLDMLIMYYCDLMYY